METNIQHKSRAITVLNQQNLPIYDPKHVLPNINSYTKFEEKLVKKWFMLKIGFHVLSS